jgi:hypothetical protein
MRLRFLRALAAARRLDRRGDRGGRGRSPRLGIRPPIPARTSWRCSARPEALRTNRSPATPSPWSVSERSTGLWGSWLRTRAASRRPAGNCRRWQERPQREGEGTGSARTLAHGIGAGLTQVVVEAKSNGISAVRELLNGVRRRPSSVITIDAMDTQCDTARAILGRGAD